MEFNLLMQKGFLRIFIFILVLLIVFSCKKNRQTILFDGSSIKQIEVNLRPTIELIPFQLNATNQIDLEITPFIEKEIKNATANVLLLCEIKSQKEYILNVTGNPIKKIVLKKYTLKPFHHSEKFNGFNATEKYCFMFGKLNEKDEFVGAWFISGHIHILKK